MSGVRSRGARSLPPILLVLLLVAHVPITPGSADGTADCQNHRTMALVGRVCDHADGILRLLDHSNAFTHGVDPADDMSVQGNLVAPPVPPVCTESLGTYHARAIYTHPKDVSSKYATRDDEFRTIIERMNGLLIDESGLFGYRNQYRVLCSGETIRVDAVQLSTTKSTTTFSSIVNDLEALGYDDPNVKYLVWHEHGSCVGGVGHIYMDDRLTVQNHNNGNTQAMFGVNFGCSGDSGVRVTMHENGHNMGAVQDSAPNSTQAGHCRDGLDIMCYSDGGLSYDPDVCPDHQRFDCNHDDYFHPTPPTGSYLDTHWNLGSGLNRFLIKEAVAPTADAGPDQDLRDADGDDQEPVTLDGTASTGKRPIVTYEWTLDGKRIATGATPTTSIPVGTNVITLTVTDEDGYSGTDDVTITVAPNRAPTADAGADQTAHDPDGDGAATVTLDGTASSDPDGTALAYTWTRDATTIATGATPTATLPVGTHTITLTVTDAGGLEDSDPVAVDVQANQAPVAVAPADQAIEDSDTSGDEAVPFDGRASYDPHGAIVTYEWHDGTTLLDTGATPTVTLPVGDHTITLTVTDAAGVTDQDTFAISILANHAPTAAFTASCSDRFCSFDASGSDDPDGDTLRYDWTFGDDTEGTGVTPGHLYPHAGRFTACLTVDDQRGRNDTTCDTVQVIADSYTQRFDTGTTPTDWTLTGLWHVSQRCAPVPSGTYYLGYHNDLPSLIGLAATCNYQTLDRTHGTASFPVDLTHATVATLSFDTRSATEQTDGTEPRDIRAVEVKAAGSSHWTLLEQWDSDDPDQADWATKSYDLADHLGTEIVVRYRFDSVDAFANHHAGWHIDHVRIRSDAAPSG